MRAWKLYESVSVALNVHILLLFCWNCKQMLATMVHGRGIAVMLLVASNSRRCQRGLLFARCLSFVAACQKQGICRNVRSLHRKCFSPHMRATLLLVNCRLKSDASISNVDHLFELGMPWTEDELRQLTENVCARNMNLSVDEMVMCVFCALNSMLK